MNTSLYGGLIEISPDGQPITPDLVLAYRGGTKQGIIHNVQSLTNANALVEIAEISFDVYKEVDGIECKLWDDIRDFRLVYIPHLDTSTFNPWYELSVEVDENDCTIKHCQGVHLQEAELGQLTLNGVEINTEDDIARDDYSPTIIYDQKNPEASALDRILKDKASHYTIVHVDSSIANLQRTFSWDGSSIKDAFDDIANEVECLFVYGEYTNNDGKIHRTISVYDLKPTASGVYGSSIKTLKIAVTDMSDKTASSGTEYTFDAFTKTGTKVVKVSATDSRGRSAAAALDVTVVDYSLPSASITASRGTGTTTSNFVSDDTGDHAKIVAKGFVSSISGNTLTPVLQYRIAGQSAWTNLDISASSLSLNDTRVIAVSDTEAYDIRVIIRDKAGREAIATMTLSNGFATMDYKAGGDGIAFGKTANRSGFDCAMLMRVFKGVNLMNENTPGGYGWSDWYYNNNGTQGKRGRIYANSDGIHIKAENGKGFLDGTWSGTLSDARMKRDIEPIAKEIILAVGEVHFKQFRMSAPDYDHDELCVGILAQDLRNAFARHGVEDKLLMLGTRKLNPDDEDEYYCIEYTHFLLVRILYDELQMQSFNERIEKLEKKLGI